MTQNRITIIGGGFSGCSVAAQLCDRSKSPLEITILEPRADLGAGVAYSVEDPDHRLNAPTKIHFLVPDKPDDFHEWFVNGGGLDRDPDAQVADGGIYVRRRELGRYISATMATYAENNVSNSRITHHRDRAGEITQTAEGFKLVPKGGGQIEADIVIIATGNQNPSAPRPFDEGLAGHLAFFKSPWKLGEIRSIDNAARTLIIGTGLTMADVVVTLIKNGHMGPILAVSRHGFSPQSQAVRRQDAPPPQPFEQIMAPPPEHFTGSLLDIFVSLRQHITTEIQNGGTWHTAFDELRDAVWQIWPGLPNSDKRQFLHHLRRWYDSHRFRLPPQTDHILAMAETDGVLEYKTARIVAAADDGDFISVQMNDRSTGAVEDHQFDAIINCTGPSEFPGDPRGYTKTNSSNQIYQSILDHGLAIPHPTKIGFDVDEHCRAIRNDGTVNKNLFAVGPPTLGAFGDPLGSPFIAAQIWRMIPTVLAQVSAN